MGRKSLLMAAIVPFMIRSVIGSLANDMGMLITARVIQGPGATFGSAVVGSLFASRLADLLAGRLPATAIGGGTPGGSNSLTPAVVNHMAAEIKDRVVSSYNNALTRIFIWVVSRWP